MIAALDVPATARVRLVEPAAATDPELAALFRRIEEQFGGVPNLFKALAHRPAILRATLDKVAATMHEGTVDRQLKEMMAVVVTDDRGCAYCVGAHAMALRRLGVPEETIALLAGDLAQSALPPAWIEVLELSRAAARDVHRITAARRVDKRSAVHRIGRGTGWTSLRSSSLRVALPALIVGP